MVDRANTEDSSELLIVDGRIGRFPERLKEGMNGKSARAFSHECELSDKMVRQYLSGQSEPTRPALIALADAANVRVEWLATGEGPKERESLPVTETESHNALRARLKANYGGKVNRLRAYGIPRDKFDAYVLHGNYVPTTEELEAICQLARWDFEKGIVKTRTREDAQLEIIVMKRVVQTTEELLAQMELHLSPEKKAELVGMMTENALNNSWQDSEIKRQVEWYLKML